MATKPLIVIVGETASGKSALALRLAEEFDGEIVCADSRTIYRYMDIGTAKPTKQDQHSVKHHLLDIVSADQAFTAADFKRRAVKAIGDIQKRGKLPIMVGGTGLYIDSVIFDFNFRVAANPAQRAELQKLTIEELQQRLLAKNIPLPFNERNPRHLIRALETDGKQAALKNLRPNTLVIGLKVDREELRQRIRVRVAQMIDQGLEYEVKALAEKYGWQHEALSAVGYREWQEYFKKRQSLEETRELIIKHTIDYAKRQRTWFSRNNSIQWVTDPSEAVDITTTYLNNLP